MGRFIPKQRISPSLLARSRPRHNNDFVAFGPGDDGFEVYIRRSVLDTMTRETLEAASNETIGLLAGRVCQDPRGAFTLIEAANGARQNEIDATPGHVRISGDSNALIRQRLEASQPALEIVGWYHSHPQSEALFSSEDKTEQRTWDNSHHVGIVISGRSEDVPFGVYRGPNAVTLPLRDSVHGIHFKGIARRDSNTAATRKSFNVAPQTQVLNPTPARDAALTPPPRPAIDGVKRANKLLSLTLIVVLLCVLAIVFWIHYRLRAMESKLSDIAVNKPEERVVVTPSPPTPQPKAPEQTVDDTATDEETTRNTRGPASITAVGPRDKRPADTQSKKSAKAEDKAANRRAPNGRGKSPAKTAKPLESTTERSKPASNKNVQGTAPSSTPTGSSSNPP